MKYRTPLSLFLVGAALYGSSCAHYKKTEPADIVQPASADEGRARCTEEGWKPRSKPLFFLGPSGKETYCMNDDSHHRCMNLEFSLDYSIIDLAATPGIPREDFVSGLSWLIRDMEERPCSWFDKAYDAYKGLESQGLERVSDGRIVLEELFVSGQSGELRKF